MVLGKSVRVLDDESLVVKNAQRWGDKDRPIRAKERGPHERRGAVTLPKGEDDRPPLFYEWLISLCAVQNAAVDYFCDRPGCHLTS